MRMFNIVLFEPEIPPNTGNIIRLCANTGCHLHLIEPLGFPMEDAKLRRAGLDYHEFASIKLHGNWTEFLSNEQPRTERLFALTTKGTGKFHEGQYLPNDYFVFGSETKGISAEVRGAIPNPNQMRLAMQESSRSLNLSNTVAIVVYEAWRQNGLSGGN
ncbi:tRNA (cytidine/uridine-2'-O-)-methyltransferase [Polynucleobacter meluiroseus]|uniref:tRNA (cytidine(34)-2'-O)-methyltransferase n=2 Tax=Polynucleobacter meluiroseus TaxID=1938814 RepID=A0A240DX87_9BURK|nr:tRNA (cytidine/uridine-2'-O-)-methyltransferase [Polynucleobacter meluiroseus]